MPSLPRSEPSSFFATLPSGVKAPQRPLTRLKEMRSDGRFHSTPREKPITVARLWPEKKGRGRNVLCGGFGRGLRNVYLLQ
jgi:hypothetical protein